MQEWAFPVCRFTSDNAEDLLRQQGKIHACKPWADGFSVSGEKLNHRHRHPIQHQLTTANRLDCKLKARRPNYDHLRFRSNEMPSQQYLEAKPTRDFSITYNQAQVMPIFEHKTNSCPVDA